MAEVGLEHPSAGEGAPAGEVASEAARERFLTPWMWLALGATGLFALTFDNVRIHDDGVLYYYFVRRLFGTDVIAEAYQFGSAYWTAPFYLGSQLVASRGEFDHTHAGEVGTVVASNVAGVLVLYLGWRILRELDLPRNPALLLLVFFGTPIYFYCILEPGLKHAADTLYMTGAWWLLLLASKEPRLRYLVGAGCLLGLMISTRYANVAIPVGVIVLFGVRRAWQPLWTVLTVTAVAAALLYAVPVVRGIPFDVPLDNIPHDLPQDAMPSDAPAFMVRLPPQRLAAGSADELPGFNVVNIDPTVPAKMLFTLHRGLFLWTPLTLFATIGYVLLLRRDRRNRLYLASLGASALALLSIHSLWGTFWDGGNGFGQRFLTALFPLFLIGGAELVRRFRFWGYAVLTLCTVFAIWLGLVIINGYRGQGGHNSIVYIVQNYTGPHSDPPPHDSFGNLAHELRVRIDHRWSVLRDVVD